MSALKKLSQLLLFLFLFPFFGFGQNSLPEWAEVSVADRSMTVYDKDTSAIAVVLADYGQFLIGEGGTMSKYKLDRHRRIKLLKKSAIDQYGSVELAYYHEGEMENIVNLKAQTILPDGSIHKLKNKDFFSAKVNDKWTTISFAFPNLEEGAIIEWSYMLVSGNVIEPRTWYFQEEIPVRYNCLKINNESRISYVSLFQGGEGLPNREKHKNKTIYSDGDTRLVYGVGEITMENAPGLKKEDFITTMDDYRAKIRLQGEYYFRRDGSKEQLYTTWEEAAKSLLDLPSFGQQFLRKKNYKKILEEVEPFIKEGMSQKEIMNTIYNFLVKNVSYNGRNQFWTNEDIEKAFIRKEANSGELNMMCLGLLKAYGIDAFPVLTSTRSHGKMYKQYPLIDQFNYLLVGIEMDGGITLLDPTDPLRPPKMPHPQALNKYGWVVDTKKVAWVDIRVPICRDIFGSELTIDEEGNIVGKLRAIFNSYTALAERHKHRRDQSGQYWKKQIEDFVQEVVLDSVSFREMGGKSDKFVNEVHFNLPNGAIQSGDFIYVSPVFHSNFLSNPFKLKKRTYPIDFSYPFEERYVSNIILPDGYTIEELPEEASYNLPESIGTFQYKVSQIGNKIQLMLVISINKVTISPNYYSDLKTMFDLMIAKREEQIVLKKINK